MPFSCEPWKKLWEGTQFLKVTAKAPVKIVSIPKGNELVFLSHATFRCDESLGSARVGPTHPHPVGPRNDLFKRPSNGTRSWQPVEVGISYTGIWCQSLISWGSPEKFQRIDDWDPTINHGDLEVSGIFQVNGVVNGLELISFIIYL